MKNLKILIPLHTLPNIKSLTTIFFDELLPVLKTKANVHVVWLIYTPDKMDITNLQHTDYTVIDIHNYENAVDVINKENPDLIFAEASWGFIDYALSSTAKFFNIPVFSIAFSTALPENRTLIKNISSYAIRFFHNSVPTDTEQNKKQFLKRTRFFLYKYMFLLKTKFVLKQDRVLSLLIIWKYILYDKLDPRFANDIVEFLESESILNQRIKMGFKRSNLILTGNPIYDSAFQKSFDSNISYKKDNIRILFAPSTLYEHGTWTNQQREFAVKETIKKLKTNPNFSITVKIHPSTSIISDYESLIHSIDPLIPIYQEGSIQKFLDNADVIISFMSSTSEVYALISKKPIIICNYFNLINDEFLERGIAINCKDPSSLISSINSAIKENPATKEKRDKFFNQLMYKTDGRASERICDKLLNLVNNKLI